MKTLVQCDFDGTITEKDASFFILDAFAQGNWRQVLQEYKQHRISVGQFNTQAFAMVTAEKDELIEYIKGKIKVRAGFRELVNHCTNKGIRFVIVSNGLEFYIEAILKDLGMENIEVHAAQSLFRPERMDVQYIGPDDSRLEDGFKEAYIKSFLKLGYRVIYVGNGASDIAPAKYAYQVLATDELLARCKENNLEYKPFDDFIDVVAALELL